MTKGERTKRRPKAWRFAVVRIGGLWLGGAHLKGSIGDPYPISECRLTGVMQYHSSHYRASFAPGVQEGGRQRRSAENPKDGGEFPVRNHSVGHFGS